MTTDTIGPKERLLATAERLFATYGIEAVSSRRIALAAGQRNQSAIRYHFGSKDALIHALRAHRVREINESRRILLEEMVRDKRSNDLRALIGAIILPLVEKVEGTPNGGNYVQFLAHLFSDRRRRDLWIENCEEAALLRRIYRLIRRQAPSVPEPLWTERLRFTVGSMIHALADRERMRATRGPAWRELSGSVFTQNLIDAAVGILTTPVSAATHAKIATSEDQIRKGTQKCQELRKPPEPRREREQLKSSAEARQLARKSAG